MSRTILVSGNCQLGATVATLAVLFPSDRVLALDYDTSAQPDGSAAYVGLLREASVWAVSNVAYARTMARAAGRPDLSIVPYPMLEFRGFHPDQCYFMKPDGVTVDPRYQSAIIGWCFRRGIDAEDVVRCFDDRVFEGLGYHDEWDRAKARLLERFVAYGMKEQFATFFAHAQRQPVFMHTINHPHTSVAVHLAKLVAIRLGARPDVLDLQVPLPDGLDDCIWPIYPSIADRLSIPGSFLFVWGRRVYDLRSFVELMYRLNRNSYPDPSAMSFAPNYPGAERIDGVLSNFLGLPR